MRWSGHGALSCRPRRISQNDLRVWSAHPISNLTRDPRIFPKPRPPLISTPHRQLTYNPAKVQNGLPDIWPEWAPDAARSRRTVVQLSRVARFRYLTRSSQRALAMGMPKTLHMRQIAVRRDQQRHCRPTTRPRTSALVALSHDRAHPGAVPILRVPAQQLVLVAAETTLPQRTATFWCPMQIRRRLGNTARIAVAPAVILEKQAPQTLATRSRVRGSAPRAQV